MAASNEKEGRLHPRRRRRLDDIDPDRNPDELATTNFQRIAKAYNELSDEGQRRKYDAQRRGLGPNSGHPYVTSFVRRNFSRVMDHMDSSWPSSATSVALR